MSFADLKRNAQSNFAKLNEEMSKVNTNTSRSSDEEDFWKPTVDKAGNGFAIIRFLTAPAGEDVPFVRVWDHGFQGPGGWYIENSLTTLGLPDPVSEHNSQLWNSGIEANKDIVRKQKRRTSYIANIRVISDPAAQENEGKEFRFKFGKKIFDKINDVMNPEFQDEKPINPFDFWNGANFKLKIRQVEGYRNYDKSEFEAPSMLHEDEAELQRIYENLKPLKTFVDPKNFKSYDELKVKLHKVLGLTPSGSQASVAKEQEAPKLKERAQTSAPAKNATVEDDDLDDYFKSLADED